MFSAEGLTNHFFEPNSLLLKFLPSTRRDLLFSATQPIPTHIFPCGSGMVCIDFVRVVVEGSTQLWGTLLKEHGDVLLK